MSIRIFLKLAKEGVVVLSNEYVSSHLCRPVVVDLVLDLRAQVCISI